MSHTAPAAQHVPSMTAQIAALQAQANLPTLARMLVSVAVTVTKWDKHYRSRRALARLEAHVLSDIGLTRSTAQAEAAKPFWQD